MKKFILLFSFMALLATIGGGIYMFHTPHQPLEIFDHQGNKVNLGPQKTYLHFWATWCMPCLSELPALDEYAGRHPEISIYPICASNDSVDKIQDIFDKLKIKHLKIYQDKESRLLHHYRIQSFPQTLEIDPAFNIVKKMSGAQQWQYYT